MKHFFFRSVLMQIIFYTMPREIAGSMLSQSLLMSIIGLLSSFLISIMFLPQIRQVYITKEANSLNYTYLCINSFSSLLGMVYSFYFEVLPMFLANLSALTSSLTLIYLKRKYASDDLNLPSVFRGDGV